MTPWGAGSVGWHAHLSYCRGRSCGGAWPSLKHSIHVVSVLMHSPPLLPPTSVGKRGVQRLIILTHDRRRPRWSVHLHATYLRTWGPVLRSLPILPADRCHTRTLRQFVVLSMPRCLSYLQMVGRIFLNSLFVWNINYIPTLKDPHGEECLPLYYLLVLNH